MFRTVLLSLLLAAIAPCQGFDDLYGQARAKAGAEDFAAALPLAEQAIALDTSRWEGHYLRAVLLLTLGRSDDARTSADEALAKAPAEHKATAQELVDRTKLVAPAGAPAGSRPTGNAAARQLVADGDAARKLGQRAKAAHKYAEAFRADASLGTAGLDAALIFLQLDETAEATRLVRALVKLEQAEVVAKANEYLEQLHAQAKPAVQQKQGDALAALQKGNLTQAISLLDAVDELWPDDAGTLYLRAKVAMQQKTPAAALSALQAAARAGFDRGDLLREDLDMAALAKDPAAAQWLEDTFGKKVVAALKARSDEPQAGSRIVTGIGLAMIHVQPQTFTMGSPANESGRDGDEQQHSVKITRGYWLAETEVTQKQWRTVMGTTPWQGKDDTTVGDDVAASHVTWDDAVEFCRRLTQQEQQAGRVPGGHVYLLPTEAQWELACRAGSRTAYCFGDDAGQLRHYAVFDNPKSGAYAHAVKSRRPNGWGFYDMHGNVWEWCADAATGNDAGDAYVEGAVDPIGKSGPLRALRGGSWGCPARWLRSADRFADQPDDAGDDLGFRPVLVARSADK